MEDIEIKALLKAYDQRLQKSISLNIRNIEEIQRLKASSVLKQIKGIRAFGIISGLVWIFAETFMIIHWWSSPEAIFFIGSAVINILVTAIAIGVYIRHLVLIQAFDNDQTIVEAQQKLVILMTSNLQIIRLMWLQLPVFFTFYITPGWIRNAPQSFWLIQAPFVLLSIFLGVWLYRNLDYRNQDKKWFKFFAGGVEWNSIKKASGLLNEIAEFKKEL